MWVMLLPATAFTVLFSYVPMAGIVVAFKDYKNRLGMWGSPWVGLENFKYLIVSDKLWSLTRNTMLYNAAFIALGLVCEAGLAIIISELPLVRIKKALQSFTFLPFFVSWVVAASIVMAIFGYESGVLNTIITSLGGERVNIYGSPAKFPIVLVLLRVWKNTGYGAIIYLATITGIDQEMYEAAIIDGANKFQQIMRITVPNLMPAVLVVFVLSFSGVMNLFEPVWAFQNPYNISSSQVIDTYIYQVGIASSRYAIGMTASLFKSVIGFAFVMAANYFSKLVTEDHKGIL